MLVKADPKKLPKRPPCSYKLGVHRDTGEDVVLSEFDRAVHMAVLGGSGSGKSKFIERIGRCNFAAGKGFCLIDPHGDTSEGLLGYAAWLHYVRGDDSLLARIHYLEPSYEMVFGYDPFKYRPLHDIAEQFRDSAYRAWLHTKVDQVSEIIQRKQGQMGFEGMPRLQRILRNVLYAVGLAVGRDGRHFPLADALVLLDLEHKRHLEVFGRVAPFLDRDVLSDFVILHTFKRVEDLRRETESTVNRLRSLLGPVLKGIFSETVNTIDFYSIIQRGEILLVNLRETDYFSADQKSAIGGLFIHEVLTTVANTPVRLRKDFMLKVDEVGEFIGEDLMRGLGAVRKYKLSLVLAGQDLSTFRKGDLDLAPKVLSQCGTVVCFQQTYKDDLDILADRLCRGDLDFAEHYQVMDRPDGYELLPMTDYSLAFNWGENWSQGGAENHTVTRSQTRNWQQARQQTWSKGRTSQSAMSHIETLGDTRSDGESRPQILRATPTLTTGRAAQQSQANGISKAEGMQESEGGGLTETDGGGDGIAVGDGSGTNFSNGNTLGGGFTISNRMQLVPKTREEWYATGKLRRSTNDQMEKFKQNLFCLGVAEAVAKFRSQNESMPLLVANVREVWSEENKWRVIERLKRELYSLRDYFFAPQISNAAQDERVNVYLQDGPLQLPDAGMPTIIVQPPAKNSPNGDGAGSDQQKPTGDDPF